MRRLSALKKLSALASTSIVGTECAISCQSAVRLTAVSPIPSASVFNYNEGLTTIPLFNLRGFSSLPPHTELQMPALSPTMSTGTILEWKVTEGQEIAAGDLLAEIETDKATIGWENQDDGIVAKLLVPAGTRDIKVGAPVVVLVDDADQVAAFKDYQSASTGSSGGDSAATQAPVAAAASVEDQAPVEGMEVSDKMGPAARTLLHEAGLSPSVVRPTGPHGMITKGDVLAAIKGGAQKQSSKPQVAPPPPAAQQQAAPTPSPPAPSTPSPAAGVSTTTGEGYTDIPTTQIRRIIASRLLESKSTIPHLYVSADVDLDNISKMREALKQQGVKVSVNDFVIKAAAMALRDTPAANCMWDAAAETIKGLPSVDISIAVATDAGLITPIVKAADGKSLSQISAEVRELAGRARANKLLPEEFMGGSFSISNLGMYGVDSFYAIINPPQACIMAVGTGRKEAKMQAGGTLTTGNVMTVTLSADHRVFDGEVAADLLKAFSDYMANPFKLVTV